MANGKEREGRPGREIFVVHKERQSELLDYYTLYCRPLYGSDVRVDEEGTIFYPTWHQLERERVGPEEYSLLSRTREREELYLARGLITKIPYELRIHQIKKEGGSVEAAIRSVEYALAGQLKKERPQMKVVRGRIGELFDLFADFSEVTEEQLEKAEKETYRRLAEVGYDPEKVHLEEKQRMANWLIKASRGKDILERRNLLITTMALQAAYRRAVGREMSIGTTLSKFARMREALRFAREFSREIFSEVSQRLRVMPFHPLFKSPDQPPKDLGIITGMLETMWWQLGQPPVKPYKPAGLAIRGVLQEAVSLLKENRRKEIVERELLGGVREILEVVLDQHQEIYPGES